MIKGNIGTASKAKSKGLQPENLSFSTDSVVSKNFQEIITINSNPIFTIYRYDWDMDKEPELEREPRLLARIWAGVSIALWVVLAAGSFLRSFLFSRADSYNPYFAEEGNSENLPSLKH